MTRPNYHFEVREHAADKAATAYGGTLNEVFEAAAQAMFATMIDLASVRDEDQRSFEIAAPSREELLRSWLADLLFAFDDEGLVFSRFTVNVAEPASAATTSWRLHAEARGQRFADNVRRHGAVVKAVTYHNFALRPPPTPDGDWVAEMVFDV